MSIEKQVAEFLGFRVKDRVSGFEGVVTHVGQDLYGCLQAIVRPPVVIDKTGAQKTDDGQWFDTSRLEVLDKKPVMKPVPLKGDKVVAGSDNRKPTR